MATAAQAEAQSEKDYDLLQAFDTDAGERVTELGVQALSATGEFWRAWMGLWFRLPGQLAADRLQAREGRQRA